MQNRWFDRKVLSDDSFSGRLQGCSETRMHRCATCFYRFWGHSGEICVIMVLLSRRRGLIALDIAILFRIPEGIATSFHRLIKLYLEHMLKASWAKPILKFEKFSLLCERILYVIFSFGPFNTFQKYLSFSILRRQASGSTPQNRRTTEGQVDRGQLIRVSKVCVWKCSSSLAKSFATVDCAALLYRV